MLNAPAQPADAVLALRALALATRRLAGPRPALRHAVRAVQVARRHGLIEPLAHARMTYAALLAETGRTALGYEECRRAAAELRGVQRGPVLAQLGLLAARIGDTEAALRYYARALPLLRRTADVHGQCRLYLNRANTLAYAGLWDAAERDLRRAAEVANGAGLAEYRSTIAENLGFVRLRRGDVLGALRHLDIAIEDADPYGRLAITCDRAEALLVAGLAGEARRELEQAIPQLADAGFAIDAAEWHLLAARAALAEGDWTAAADRAAHAAEAFRRQRRRSWELLARHVLLAARFGGGERSGRLRAAARRLAAELAGRWPESATRALVICGEIEAARRRADQAIGYFHDAAALVVRHRHPPAQWRAAAYYARARAHTLSGNLPAARASLRAGLRIVREYAASLGATDLRISAAAFGRDLAEEGLRLALRSGRPSVLLEWSEIARATALRSRPLRPPADPELAADLAELRRVTGLLADAIAVGEDARPLRARQTELENRIRHRARLLGQQVWSGELTAPCRTPVLAAALGDRTLVAYVAVDGNLFAVTMHGRRCRLTALPGYREIRDELRSLRFSMQRIAHRHGSAAARSAAVLARDHAIDRLRALLLAPLRLPDSELIVIPTGDLHAVPWSALVDDRPVTVAPAAHLWLGAVRSSAGRNHRVTVVAGPRLAHAGTEIRAVAARYPRAQVLTAETATVDAVRAAMDGADLVHIAAHGRFRSDNPLFSAIELADGPLTVYDVEELRRPPRVLVLSACESGLSAVHPGDELMGLTAALLGMGTRTVIASVCPVPDDLTAEFMTEFHRNFAARADAAAALFAARNAIPCDGFLCLGAA